LRRGLTFEAAQRAVDRIGAEEFYELERVVLEIVLLALGNPSRSSGRFKECWTRLARAAPLPT